MAESDPKIRVRMYRQGLGDCFLLTFYTGPTPVHMLVDCGSIGAATTKVRLDDVVADIAAETDGHLHLLIATHEHQDHVSGFRSQKELFDTFQVDRVWAAWTENPEDPLARKVKKYAGDLRRSLQLAVNALSANQQVQSDAEFRAIGAAVGELLEFSGDPGAEDVLAADGLANTVQAAMSYVTSRGKEQTKFLSPGRVIEPAWLRGIRFYVLGPPRSEAALGELGDHHSPELYHLAAAMGRDLGRTLGFVGSNLSLSTYRNQLSSEEREEFDAGVPFDDGFRIGLEDAERKRYFEETYDNDYEAWRRIDLEWIRALEDLALQLDNATNNTSLVLAIELIGDGRVLLLPADAQLGNWRSWQTVEFTVAEAGATRTVRSDDLLKQTVFYKVGHHASHNATLNEHGLEAMEHPDLVAMIPVDRKVALNKRPHKWDMPASALYTRLIEKTRGRVLRSDTGWPEATGDPPPPPLPAAWIEARENSGITVGDLFIDYVVR